MKKQLSLVVLSVAMLMSGYAYGAPQGCVKAVLGDDFKKAVEVLSACIVANIKTHVTGAGLEIHPIPFGPSVLFPTAEQTIPVERLKSVVDDVVGNFEYKSDGESDISVGEMLGFGGTADLNQQIIMEISADYLAGLQGALESEGVKQGFFSADRQPRGLNPKISLFGVRAPGQNRAWIPKGSPLRENWADLKGGIVKDALEKFSSVLRLLPKTIVQELVIYDETKQVYDRVLVKKEVGRSSSESSPASGERDPRGHAPSSSWCTIL